MRLQSFGQDTMCSALGGVSGALVCTLIGIENTHCAQSNFQILYIMRSYLIILYIFKTLYVIRKNPSFYVVLIAQLAGCFLNKLNVWNSIPAWS